KRQNKDGPALLGERRAPRLLTADELSRGLEDQTLALVDTRPVDQVHAGTVPGALSIPSLGQAATHIAWAFDPERDEADLVALAADAQTAAADGVWPWAAGPRVLGRIARSSRTRGRPPPCTATTSCASASTPCPAT